MKKKWNIFGNYCIPKGKNEGHIIGMYVCHFFMWMTMEKWHLMHFKSCIISCVIPIICFPLTKKQN